MWFLRGSLLLLVAHVTTQSALQVNISMPVDHFTSSDKRTYNQRYWLNDTFYRPGGPIIISDFGEEGISDAAAAATVNGAGNSFSPPLELAKTFGGLVVVWEHRFYGYSQPCPLDVNSIANVQRNCSYQYLTVAQALQDVVYFAHHPNFPGRSASQLASMSAGQTPWIFIGGSYAGARAAWIRVRNPETIYASWSSSGTVSPLVDGSSYFNTQARTLAANCSEDINAALAHIDLSLGSHNSSIVEDMKIRLATTGDAIYNGFDVNQASVDDANRVANYDLVSGPVSAFVGDFQYSGPNNTFCDHLERFNLEATSSSANITAVFQNKGDGNITAGGLVSSGASPQTVANAYLWAAVAQSHAVGQPQRKSSPSSGSKLSRSSLPPAPAVSSADFSFGWTVVTETGAYQSWSSDYARFQAGRAVLSRYADQATLRQRYIAPFHGVDTSLIPAKPNITTVLQYGGWNMTPSNVMFSTGQYDPWRTFEVFSEDQEIGAPKRGVTQQVPKCNTPPAGTDVFGLIYPDADHVPDLTTSNHGLTSSSPSVLGFNLFKKSLQAWLPCFEEH